MSEDGAVMQARRRAEILIVLAALLFSTGGAAIKACALSSWQVASFRSGIAAAVILLFVPAARRGWSRRTVMVGLAYAATRSVHMHRWRSSQR